MSSVRLIKWCTLRGHSFGVFFLPGTGVCLLFTSEGLVWFWPFTLNQEAKVFIMHNRVKVIHIQIIWHLSNVTQRYTHLCFAKVWKGKFTLPYLLNILACFQSLSSYQGKQKYLHISKELHNITVMFFICFCFCLPWSFFLLTLLLIFMEYL